MSDLRKEIKKWFMQHKFRDFVSSDNEEEEATGPGKGLKRGISYARDV